jgi:hypothetical protein
MNRIKHRTAATLVAIGAVVALSALASPASARWEDNRRDWSWNGNDRYNGYYYRAPPVVYGTPYYNGYYYPPPVVYDNSPTFTIRIR